MSLFKFEPAADITAYELAIVLRTFFLAMHNEGPDKNLEVGGEVVDFLSTISPEFSRHFQSVEGYD